MTNLELIGSGLTFAVSALGVGKLLINNYTKEVSKNDKLRDKNEKLTVNLFTSEVKKVTYDYEMVISQLKTIRSDLVLLRKEWKDSLEDTKRILSSMHTYVSDQKRRMEKYESEQIELKNLIIIKDKINKP